jgi:hypothetical protein
VAVPEDQEFIGEVVRERIVVLRGPSVSPTLQLGIQSALIRGHIALNSCRVPNYICAKFLPVALSKNLGALAAPLHLTETFSRPVAILPLHMLANCRREY